MIQEPERLQRSHRDGTLRRASIPEAISAYAAANGNDIAVADRSRTLSYGALERESNRVAALLRDLGAGPERCVGILLERSAEFVVAALAVLKTGAAYVPLDISAPAERAELAFSDASVTAVITQSSHAERLRNTQCAVVAIDRVPNRGSCQFDQAPTNAQTPAYIIYTSGSSGTPKGVEITHAGLANLIAWHQPAFSVTSKDRASQLANVAFDAAVWEIWPHLTAGATLVIVPESARRSAELLRDWLVEEKITIAFIPTALAEQLFTASWPAHTSLRVLLTGGDILRRRPPIGLPFSVVNNYGPTECTVVATSGTVAPDASGLPSIGRPIANAAALILDESLRPVPTGERGELCIGGPLVARGYRNLPALNAQQFVTYIAASGESLKLYRTGDRARWLDTGEIEFLGRLDRQVKIRGYRIELGEVEARLAGCGGVLGCAAAVCDLGSTGAALVAYVVLDARGQWSERQLRAELAQKLPEYMLPATFVSLEALPLNRNGKLDYAALPAPSPANVLGNREDVAAPLSKLEQQLAELVAAMMSRPSVGPNENLFMIGGHSMFGAQLIARIRETFEVQLPLRRLFAAPTVRRLSMEIERLREERQTPSAP